MYSVIKQNVDLLEKKQELKLERRAEGRASKMADDKNTLKTKRSRKSARRMQNEIVKLAKRGIKVVAPAKAESI